MLLELVGILAGLQAAQHLLHLWAGLEAGALADAAEQAGDLAGLRGVAAGRVG